MLSKGTKSKTIKNILLVVFVSVVCKLAGLIKQLVIAAFFGTNGEIDTFLLVNGTITDLGTAVFASFTIVYLNQLVKMRENNDPDFKKYNTKVAFYFSIISLVISSFLFFFSPFIVRILGPGLSNESIEAGIRYMLVLSPLLILICFRAIIITILDSKKCFVYGKSLGLIQSITIIFVIIFFNKIIGIDSLLYATVGSLVFEVIIGVIVLLCKREFKFEKTNLKIDNNMKVLFFSMLPLLISNTIMDINALIDRAVASNLGEGYISAISYSQTLKQFVFAVLVTSIASVMYTDFSVDFVSGDMSNLSKKVNNYTYLFIIIMIPVSLVTIFNAKDIVTVVFKRGEFSDTSVDYSSAALIGYGAGFVFYAIQTILLRLYFSSNNTKFPLIATSIGIVIGIIVKFSITPFIGVLGITLSSSVAYFITSVVLAIGTNKKVCKINWKSIALTFIKVICVATIVSAVILVLNKVIVVYSLLKLFIVTLVVFGLFALGIIIIDFKRAKNTFLTFLKFLKRRKNNGNEN